MTEYASKELTPKDISEIYMLAGNLMARGVIEPETVRICQITARALDIREQATPMVVS